MYICYLGIVVSFLCMLTTGIQGYLSAPLFGVKHSSIALFSIIIYLFTQTLIMFFFIGCGISIKEYTEEHNLSLDFRKAMIALKHKIFPPQMLNIGLFMALFIMGGAVDTKVIPAWIHGVLFIIAMLHLIKLTVIQHGGFRKNTAIILDMSGIPSPLNQSNPDNTSS